MVYHGEGLPRPGWRQPPNPTGRGHFGAPRHPTTEESLRHDRAGRGLRGARPRGGREGTALRERGGGRPSCGAGQGGSRSPPPAPRPGHTAAAALQLPAAPARGAPARPGLGGQKNLSLPFPARLPSPGAALGSARHREEAAGPTAARLRGTACAAPGSASSASSASPPAQREGAVRARRRVSGEGGGGPRRCEGPDRYPAAP